MPAKINDGLTNRQRYYRRNRERLLVHNRAKQREWARKDRIAHPERHKYKPAATEKERLIRNEISRKAYQRRAEFLRELKNQPCADCGREYPHYVMEFDHVIPQKGDRFNRLIGFARLVDEMAKCEVVCANCHNIREWERKHHSH